MQVIIDNLIDILQEKKTIRQVPAEGKSMYPLIKHGDNIHIKFIKPENARIGDIAAFRRNNVTIVHRLIKKNGSGFIEKGDFQIRGQFIKTSDIFGRVEINPSLNKRPGLDGQTENPRIEKGRASHIIFNHTMALLGYIIHKLGRVAKPLLIISFIINAGTRIYIKLRKD